MGIWKRSAFARQLARNDLSLAGAFGRALPDWTARDVAGSAYSIAGYEPDRRIGTWEDLADIRVKLHARGMRLMVDFIPNHTGFDHPWIQSHPNRYVQGDESAFRDNPGAFRAIDTPSGDVRFIACGRDPYYLPWNDVAQLDYSNADTRAAMVDVLERLARHVDGARCDMAMLVLSDVFSSTWRRVPANTSHAGRRILGGREIGRAEVHSARRGLLGYGVAAAAAWIRLHVRQAALRQAPVFLSRRCSRTPDG